MGRLIDADILIAELKESAIHHCNNPREDSLLQRDRVIVRAQPTVEAISKAEYENRLKADMVAMLTDIQLEIEEKEFLESSCSFMDKTEEKNYAVYTDDISKVIQQKINSLKEQTDDNEDC